MNKYYLSLFFALALGLAACQQKTPPAQLTPEPNNDKLLVATLYHQQSAERDALCYQAYAIARTRLDAILKQNTDPSRLAIVLDLDETVLDNSPYEALCIRDNISYPEGWDEWMHAASAKALPGAIDFLNYTKSTGVQIFYITNRKEKYRQATLVNLQKLDIASASEKHLLLRSSESSKEIRRQEVLQNYQIVMLFGDNLADFSQVFDGEKSTAARQALTDSLQSEFGNRFIVFPNAMYGDWLNAVIDYNFDLLPEAIIEKQKSKLEAF